MPRVGIRGTTLALCYVMLRHRREAMALTHHESSKELVAEKKHFGESRLVRDTSLVGAPADQ